MRLRLLAATFLSIGLYACASPDPVGDPSTTTTTRPEPTTTTRIDAATTTLPVPPIETIGDTYFPDLGTTGFDVSNYDLALRVDPETGGILGASAHIAITTRQALAEIHLDLVGLEVTTTMIDGSPVDHRRDEGKLVLVAEFTIAPGTEIVATVEYRGQPDPFFIPGFDTRAGWVVTAEGVHVIAEPDGARTWFPANDHPTDKATFTISITVPEPFIGVSNGRLVEMTAEGGWSTSMWRMDHPMATYLATIIIGELTAVSGGSAGSVPIVDYLPSDLVASPPPALSQTAAMLTFLEEWFGPYPFSTYGHAVVADLPFALETQTMTVIGRSAVTELTVVHEIAHQWFGNSVSVSDWRDIWLNEGFASFAELLWIEHTQGSTALRAEVQRRYDHMAATPRPLVGDPGPAEMFDLAVYWRGGLTLHALRSTVGDTVLRDLLTEYASRYADSDASTSDFIAVAEEISGQGLAELFDGWLFQAEIPPLPD